jgi:arginine deiminase
VPDSATPAAYGGPGWSPRTASLDEELGSIWARCGIDCEWQTLRAVLLHRPGDELRVADPDAAQMLDAPDVARAGTQHDALADAYRAAGVAVHYVEPEPGTTVPPNLMFCADLFVMTPAGAIVGRPASTVRAGEERWIARRLAGLGVPILRSVAGAGTFEGADAMWLDRKTVLLGTGVRTNDEGARQVAASLAEQHVATIRVPQPQESMHLMGHLRIVDRDLALTRRGLLDDVATTTLRERGFQIRCFPDDAEMERGSAHNVVVLGPRRIIMPAGNPITQRFCEGLGIEAVPVEVDELAKAAGAIGCLTGVLHREAAR